MKKYASVSVLNTKATMMHPKTILMMMLVLCAIELSQTSAFAQGGWDVWTIELRDGRKFDASPVWSLDAKELKYGFHSDGTGSGTPAARPQLLIMSNNLNNSRYRTSKGTGFVFPAMPKGNFKQDLVVLDDGKRRLGPVKILAEKNASGKPDIYNAVLIQNGVKTPMTSVAFIKFATHKR